MPRKLNFIQSIIRNLDFNSIFKSSRIIIKQIPYFKKVGGFVVNIKSKILLLSQKDILL